MERLYLFVFICLFFAAMASATQFKVGGSNGWRVPAPNTTSYNQWAQANRFKIGDSLVFTYQQQNDSVLVVDQGAYNTCNTSSYIKKFADGNSVFTFDQSGPFFFISGIQNNCLKKESLAVIVLANRTRKFDSQPSSSPPSISPTVSPVVNLPPSPDTSVLAPVSTPGELTPPGPPPPNTGESVPVMPPTEAGTTPNPSKSPPPSEETNTNPATPSVAPSGEENPNAPSPPSPNGASLKIVELISSTGPLLGLILLVL